MIELSAEPTVAAALLPFREGGALRLAVIAKLTFDLSRQGAQLVAPRPLSPDVHFEGNASRSLAFTSDRVPRKPQADVLFIGSAWAPPGEHVRARRVRLTVSEGTMLLVDKALDVVSDEPFRQLPIRYELAEASSENPLGGGRFAIHHADEPLTTGKPRVHPAGFGPVPRTFPARARLRGRIDDDALATAPIAELPAGFDASYFNAAPADQRTRFFSGREELRLVGLHPTLADVRSKLPAQIVRAVLLFGASSIEVPMVGDTLAIEGDTLSATLTFRGDVAIDEHVLQEGRVVVTVIEAPEAGKPKLAPRSKAFVETERKVAPAIVARPQPASQKPAPRPRGKTFSATQELPPSFGAFTAPIVPPSAPFANVAPPPLLSPSSEAPPIRVAFDEEPSSMRAPTSSMRVLVDTPAQLGELRPPPRLGEAVPIVNVGKLVPFTFPWSLRPPQDALIVAVKGTFDLVPGAAAKPAEEQDLPSGDAHWDDDPAASLRYPSDFAPFKPKADVMLVGSAHRQGDRGVSLVRFRFGPIERRIAVFGDRTKERGAHAPAPFETMPLRWERALGGALSRENPVGIGHKTGMLLPNLEDADALLGRAAANVPVCTAPVAPSWSARSGKLGTYDRRWQETRWPWFPEDFEWSYFNAAPREQQIEYPEGDESYALAGVAAGGAVLEGRMPEKRPRVFALRMSGELFEILLRIDTVWFDADAKKLVVVWRGLVEVDDETAPEISTLFAIDDEPELDVARARERLHAELAARGLLPPEAAPAQAANDDLAGLSLGELYQRMQRDLEKAKEERRPAPAEAPAAAPAPTRDPAAPVVSADQVLAALREGRSLEGEDLSFVALDGLDLRGADLHGAILSSASLRGTRLDGANLRGAVLAHADAEQAGFDGADLEGADLTSAKLDRADLSRTKLSNALFESASASGASFVESTGERPIFTRATLTFASFERASLSDGDLTGAKLEAARFTGAKLPNARFYDVEGMDVNLDGVSAPGLRAEGARLPRGSFVGLDAPDSGWERAELEGSSFQGAVLPRALFNGAKLDDVIFSKADLGEGRFRKARLLRAKMLKTNLMKATFERADLDGADLRGANLFQVATWRARTHGVRLEQAITAGTTL